MTKFRGLGRIFIPPQNECVRPSVSVSVCVQNISVCQSACGGINSFPNNPWFSRVFSSSFWNTLWEKEKLLVTSNFFFSHSVFYPFS